MFRIMVMKTKCHQANIHMHMTVYRMEVSVAGTKKNRASTDGAVINI